MSTSTGDRGVNGNRIPVDSPAEPVGLEGYPRSAGDLGDFGDRSDTSTEGALVERTLSGTLFPNSWQVLRMTEPTWPLKETASRHTLLEGGDTSGETVYVVGEIRALSVERRCALVIQRCCPCQGLLCFFT